MQSVLIDEWLDGLEPIPILDEASVALARELVRKEARAHGLTEIASASLVNVASELAHNQRAHARGGRIAVRRVLRAGVAGLEVIAADCGPGIASPADALRGQAREPEPSGIKTSLGVGLSAVLELSDEVDFDVRIGEGTCVWARKFASAVPRRREVGVYGRPYPGEAISGDHGAFVRGDHALVVGLADGLGHGPPAREASNEAIGVLRAQSSLLPDRVLEQCHAALGTTRGAVMAVARIVEDEKRVVAGSMGNVATHVYGRRASRRASGPSFVLGAAGLPRRPAVEEHPFERTDVLVLFSDGLSTGVDIEQDLDLRREHPIIIAQRILERFGRGNDDALVLVVR